MSESAGENGEPTRVDELLGYMSAQQKHDICRIMMGPEAIVDYNAPDEQHLNMLLSPLVEKMVRSEEFMGTPYTKDTVAKGLLTAARLEGIRKEQIHQALSGYPKTEIPAADGHVPHPYPNPQIDDAPLDFDYAHMQKPRAERIHEIAMEIHDSIGPDGRQRIEDILREARPSTALKSSRAPISDYVASAIKLLATDMVDYDLRVAPSSYVSSMEAMIRNPALSIDPNHGGRPEPRGRH